MSSDLTNSAVDRQHILNNPYTLSEIEKPAGIRGIPFEGKTVVLKEQVAVFLRSRFGQLRIIWSRTRRNWRKMGMRSSRVTD